MEKSKLGAANNIAHTVSDHSWDVTTLTAPSERSAVRNAYWHFNLGPCDAPTRNHIGHSHTRAIEELWF